MPATGVTAVALQATVIRPTCGHGAGRLAARGRPNPPPGRPAPAGQRPHRLPDRASGGGRCLVHQCRRQCRPAGLCRWILVSPLVGRRQWVQVNRGIAWGAGEANAAPRCWRSPVCSVSILVGTVPAQAAEALPRGATVRAVVVTDDAGEACAGGPCPHELRRTRALGRRCSSHRTHRHGRPADRSSPGLVAAVEGADRRGRRGAGDDVLALRRPRRPAVRRPGHVAATPSACRRPGTSPTRRARWSSP